MTLCGRDSFFPRLTDAFGWRYVAAVVLTYGANQGVGEQLVFNARRYFLFDGMNLDSASAAQLNGFSRIPWQLKSCFGLLSDTLPICGYRRGPYMIIAGVLGITASLLLAVLPAASLGAVIPAVLLLFSNVNFAMPDVMIDATVAERAKAVPHRAADLQALCWGSLGVCGMVVSASLGYLNEAGGYQLLFGLSVVTSACVLISPALGWLGEKRRPGGCGETRQLCRSLVGTLAKRRVLIAAGLVGCYSFSLGLVQLLVAPLYPDAVGLGTQLTNLLLCGGLYAILRTVDATLAKAVLFPFVRGALCPRADVIFEWAHAPAAASGDDRCWSADACLAAAASTLAPLERSLRSLEAATDDDPTEAPGLPCGWAKANGAPCLF